jgi:endonuclease III
MKQVEDTSVKILTQLRKQLPPAERKLDLKRAYRTLIEAYVESQITDPEINISEKE